MPEIPIRLIATTSQAAAELIENVADSEGVDAQQLTDVVVEQLSSVYVEQPVRSSVQFAEEIVRFVLDWGTDPDDPEFRDEDIAVNGYDEHNRARIATDLARAKFGAAIGDVPQRV